MMSDNIFRQAKELLHKKEAGGELTEAEEHIISAAEIPMNVRDSPIPQDIPIPEVLEGLAKIVEEAKAK